MTLIKTVAFICDHCHDETEYEETSVGALRSRLKSEGWTFSKDIDLCPNCLASGRHRPVSQRESEYTCRQRFCIDGATHRFETEGLRFTYVCDSHLTQLVNAIESPAKNAVVFLTEGPGPFQWDSLS